MHTSQSGKWAKKGLSQVSKYTLDAKVPKRNTFSLCFECIGFTEIDLINNYKQGIQSWRVKQKSELNGFDFYALIELTSNVDKDWCFYDDQDQLYFPALAVYGKVHR